MPYNVLSWPLLFLLAEGSCMAAFEWNKGGEWGGKPWSPELPTDSALLFYLFASYLAAPQWLFPQVSWGAPVELWCRRVS